MLAVPAANAGAVTVAGTTYPVPAPSVTPPIAPSPEGFAQFIQDVARIGRQIQEGVRSATDTVEAVGGIARDPQGFRQDLHQAGQLGQLMPFLIGGVLLLVVVLLLTRR